MRLHEIALSSSGSLADRITDKMMAGENVLNYWDRILDDYESDAGCRIDKADPRFLPYQRSWLRMRVERAISELSPLFYGQPIRAYRAIYAAHIDPKRHPGLYWTLDRDMEVGGLGTCDNTDPGADTQAEPHLWWITADIPTSSVNWIETITAHADDGFRHEQEIQIKPNAPVNIISVEKDEGR